MNFKHNIEVNNLALRYREQKNNERYKTMREREMFTIKKLFTTKKERYFLQKRNHKNGVQQHRDITIENTETVSTLSNNLFSRKDKIKYAELNENKYVVGRFLWRPLTKKSINISNSDLQKMFKQVSKNETGVNPSNVSQPK